MMQTLLRGVAVVGCLLFVAVGLYAQDYQYDIGKLAHEPIEVLSAPKPAAPYEKGDTSFTLYQNSSVSLRTYFVNGEQYDNVFHPNPTGVYMAGQRFEFFCDFELAYKQNVNFFMDVKEFAHRGRRYLVMINFREDCLGSGCLYRCYNLFDITDPQRVQQMAFNSIFEGMATFAEVNADGGLDLIRAAPKRPNADDGYFYYQLTSYSLNAEGARPVQHQNANGHAHYVLARGEEDLREFEILQADWHFAVKDTSGRAAPQTSYFPPYISFDPMHTHLFDPDGVRIEKNRYSIMVRDFNDLEAAKRYCAELQGRRRLGNVFIMIDQYGQEISYQILVGNFANRDVATRYRAQLGEQGLKGELVDFRQAY